MEAFDFEYKKLNSKYLVVVEDYQRLLRPHIVKKIVSEYNPNIVNPIKVSSRDGKYYVFDGQHTLRSLVAKNGGDLLVDCKVYYGMTYEDEARLFALQNGESRNVDSASKLRALYEAKDEDVVGFKELVESCGILCSFKKSGSGANRYLVCYKSAFDIYMKYGKEHSLEVLNTVLSIWNGEGESLRKEIVCGMDIFIRTYKGQYSKTALIKRLSNVSPKTLCRDGKAFVNGGDRRFARIILQYYNRNTTTNRLEDKL